MEDNKTMTIAVVAIVAIVALASLVLVLNKGSITGVAVGGAGGQGRVKGQCMKDCMAEFGQNGEEFDKNSAAVQDCHGRCPSAAIDSSSCEAHSDNCCVPFTGDPDCSGAAGSGGCPAFDESLIAEWTQHARDNGYTISYIVNPTLPVADCNSVHDGGGFNFKTGRMGPSEPLYAFAKVVFNYTVVYGPVQVNDITMDEYNACKALMDTYCYN
ncbi:hypothetical protein KY342_04195 [Candidatus Woesearchaeota archaeon]|nr:hypothetical protein [Candidatus Woesearchaeota archaeon]